MVNEDRLSAVLSDFARTLATDFPIQGILDHLVRRIVDILPITGAGVTLISPGMAPRYVAASDTSALRYERLQAALGQGPCVAAYESGEPVAVPDLLSDDRFPLFVPDAVQSGLRAVFTFPLRQGERRLGALDLYRETPGVLAEHDMDVAQTLADVAAAYLLNAWARDEAHATAERFRRSALHDPLTGLPNRLLLQQRLEHAALRAQRSHADAAVLFADLDDFKAVNDAHGHQVGDELLVAVARRLTALVRPGDTLARISGDEFVFLCEDLTSAADVAVLARRVDEAFVDPFVTGGHTLRITASVGVAYAGPGGDISDELVAKADNAMYRAKRRGGAGHEIIDLREGMAVNTSLERDLRVAIAREELEVAYQPIVRSSDGGVTGVEALLRWSHPQRGTVSPLTLVRVAEQSHLINEIGAWVLERSCLDRGTWLREHPESPLDVAVNVSPRQLVEQDLPATVAAVLQRTGMDPAALVLEMTENIFIEDSAHAMSVLGELRELGIRLALDDFGTGFSALSYLRRLPIDILKIDQGFIADIGLLPTGGHIVAAVTDLAHVLGLAVTAEGVETRAQREQISLIGCDYAQGFYYARPMPAPEIAARLAAKAAPQLTLPVGDSGAVTGAA